MQLTNQIQKFILTEQLNSTIKLSTWSTNHKPALNSIKRLRVSNAQWLGTGRDSFSFTCAEVIKREIRFSTFDSQSQRKVQIEINRANNFSTLNNFLYCRLELYKACTCVCVNIWARMFSNYFPCCIAVHEFLTSHRFSPVE